MNASAALQSVLVLALLGGCATSGSLAVAHFEFRDLILRAEQLETEMRFEEAARLWLRTTEIRRDYVPGYINAAETYQRVGKFKTSLGLSETAKRFGGGQLEPFLLSGRAKFAMRDYEGALEDWRRLKEMEPRITESDRLIGEAEEARKNWKGAFEAYKRVTDAEPKRAEILLAIARVHAQSGETQAALETLGKALKAGLDRRLVVEDIRLASVRAHPNFNAMLSEAAAMPRQPGTREPVESERPLFTRLGGFTALDMIGGDFAVEAISDPRIDQRVVPIIQKKIVAVVCEASGGPCKDLLDAAAEARMSLSEDDIRAIAENLKKSLTKFRVQDATREHLVSAVTTVKPGLTGAE